MSSKLAKDREPISYQALLDENKTLHDEVQNLRARLEDAEELKRAISEGDLDALVMPGPEGELIFTLDSADRAYRVLVETMNEGTATLTFDGTILYCNHQFAELLKMPLHTIVGTSIYRFIAPENAIKFKALLKQEVGRGEINFQSGEGTSLPVYLSISSLQSERSPNAWCLVATDLTEQKKNEEIVAAEHLARSIIEQAAEAIIVCDTSGRITHFSNAMPKLCGCDPTFQIFENLMDVQYSEGEDAGKSILPVSSALKGLSILGVEATLELKDSQKFHLLLNSGPLKNNDGKIIGCVVTLADITERKQLEEQTRRGAEELATLMEKAPVAIWVGHDPQSHNITGNRMATELYEAEVGENVSANATPVRRFFDKGRELTADELPMQQASLKDIDVLNVELDMLLPSGNWRVILGSASPLHDAEGHVRGSVGAFIDITERKRTEEELREAYEQIQTQSEKLRIFNEELKTQSEELKETNEALYESEKRFRTLAENSPDIIARFDRQKRHMYANPSVAGPYGRSPEEIIGKTQSELGRYSDQLKFLEKHYENVFVTGKPETIEFQYISPQGKEYYLNTKIVPEFVDGKVTSVLAISRDIKDIKEAEAKLKETLDNLENIVKERTIELEKAYDSLKESERGLAEAQKMAHIGNWDLDLVTGEVHWSNETYRIFGLIPQELDLTYDKILGYVHPDDRNYVKNSIKEAFNGKPFDMDYRIILANKEERIVHTHVEIIFDEKNTPVRVRGTVQDITERRKAEEALEKIDKTRIKEIHHRIKNNLQVICSLLSLEAERFTDEKMLEALRESQNRVTSMALIHEELYKGGKNDSVDFAAYLQKLTADLFSSYNLGNDNINLKMDLDQVYLEMDTAIPLGIIVNELVSNSLKHAFPAGGKGEININLCKNENFAVKCNVSVPGPDCMEKNGFYYALTVTDNGKGIPEEIEFQNADSLGLQLINILVEQIDGCIELKRNNGTKFTIWFSNIE